MTKALITGLLAAIACTLMACGSAEGPSESDPASTESSSTTEKAAAAWYMCNGTHYPCSSSELDAIMSSPTFDKKTGHFTSTTLGNCQTCYGASAASCSWD